MVEIFENFDLPSFDGKFFFTILRNLRPPEIRHQKPIFRTVRVCEATIEVNFHYFVAVDKKAMAEKEGEAQFHYINFKLL